MGMKAGFCLSSSYKTILRALAVLEEAGYRTSAKGLYEILLGLHHDEKAKDLPCYGHYASLGKRSFYTKIRMLERNGYLAYAYEKRIDDYLLLRTEKGKREETRITWKKHPRGVSTLIEIKGERE